MTTRVESFRDHCRRMSTAEHKLDCLMLTAVEPYWPPGGWVPEYDDGADVCPSRLRWLGPKPAWEPPHCDGCMTDHDRALFAQLADEADAYTQGSLL